MGGGGRLVSCKFHGLGEIEDELNPNLSDLSVVIVEYSKG
jgi:hypothetical protein